MVQRFEAQERLKQEILERERQIKRIEANDEEVRELKKNIHKKYLRTKYKKKYGTSRWHRENSEEMVNKMYARAGSKQKKFEKIEKEKQEQKEKELKGMFKPKILKSVESWENLKRNQKKIDSRIKKKEKKRVQETKAAVARQDQRFKEENSGTVFSRLQEDLEGRRDRERKRRQLKKFKDKHFKEYTDIMENGLSDEEEDELCEH